MSRFFTCVAMPRQADYRQRATLPALPCSPTENYLSARTLSASMVCAVGEAVVCFCSVAGASISERTVGGLTLDVPFGPELLKLHEHSAVSVATASVNVVTVFLNIAETRFLLRLSGTQRPLSGLLRFRSG